MRLVDADALLAEYDRVHEGPPGAARALIENAPTIEIPADVQAAYLQGQIEGLRWGLKRIREIGKRLSLLTEPLMERSRE